MKGGIVETHDDLDYCKCGNIPTLIWHYINNIPNRVNYFVKCYKCNKRTRDRNSLVGAIEDWNKSEGILKQNESFIMVKKEKVKMNDSDIIEKTIYKVTLGTKHSNVENYYAEFFDDYDTAYEMYQRNAPLWGKAKIIKKYVKKEILMEYNSSETE